MLYFMCALVIFVILAVEDPVKLFNIIRRLWEVTEIVFSRMKTKYLN